MDINQKLNDLLHNITIKAIIYTPLGELSFEGSPSDLGVEIFKQDLIFGENTVSYTILENDYV